MLASGIRRVITNSTLSMTCFSSWLLYMHVLPFVEYFTCWGTYTPLNRICMPKICYFCKSVKCKLWFYLCICNTDRTFLQAFSCEPPCMIYFNLFLFKMVAGLPQMYQVDNCALTKGHWAQRSFSFAIYTLQYNFYWPGSHPFTRWRMTRRVFLNIFAES